MKSAPADIQVAGMHYKTYQAPSGSYLRHFYSQGLGQRAIRLHNSLPSLLVMVNRQPVKIPSH